MKCYDSWQNRHDQAVIKLFLHERSVLSNRVQENVDFVVKTIIKLASRYEHAVCLCVTIALAGIMLKKTVWNDKTSMFKIQPLYAHVFEWNKFELQVLLCYSCRLISTAMWIQWQMNSVRLRIDRWTAAVTIWTHSFLSWGGGSLPLCYVRYCLVYPKIFWFIRTYIQATKSNRLFTF